jgi:ferrochelatase
MYAKCAALLACVAAATAFHAPAPMALGRSRATLSSAQRPQRAAAVGPKMQVDMSRMFGGALSGASATIARKGASGSGIRPGDKVGILFLNLGGPEKLDEVEDFLYNLFNDEDIIRLPNVIKPLQGYIARGIASRRAPNSREAYESIGGGSPIVKLTQEQGDNLCKELKKRGVDAKAYIGMRYWYPFTEEATDKILEDGINRLVIIPLYPQYSISTTGSSIRLLEKILAEDLNAWDPRKIDHTVIPDWYNHPGYLATQAKLINKELEEFKRNPSEVKVMFSAHGVPESYVAAGDPYKGQIESCADLIMKEVNKNRAGDAQIDWTLSFQSRVGPVKWLEPYTDTVLEELGAAGLKNLVVVPISFTSEHVETLEEIDIEYREVAVEAGITNFKRCPALNSDPLFIDALADMTQDALSKPSLRISETLDLYQKSDEIPGYPWEFGVTKAAEQTNGRLAMLAIASLAVTQVIRAGCPKIDGPAIAGKEPFCAAFSADGWNWLFSAIQTALHL